MMGLELYADDVGGNFYELVYLDWDCLHNILGEKAKRKQNIARIANAELNSVTLNRQVTKIFMNLGSQLSEKSLGWSLSYP